MKLIIFTYFFPKISETFILNRITRLIDAGVDVRIFALKNPAIVKAYEDNSLETMVHPDVIKYKLMDKVEYFPKKASGEMDYESIVNAVKRFSPDVVHVQWGNLGEDLLSRISFPLPTVVSFHSHLTPRTWKVQQAGFENVFQKASLILPVSNYIKDGLVKMGCNTNKIVVHHMGVDTKLFTPTEKQDREKATILSVGSFIEKKGFQDALTAVGLLSNGMRNNLRYRLVGDGPMRERYMEIVEKCGLSQNVVFFGKLTQDRVIEEYQKADIYIHPSVQSSEGDDEGIPTVIMEAQSCSLPVVSTFHTGIPEIVEDGVSGLLSKEHDCADISSNLTKLIIDSQRRLEMGNAGREIVLKEFNVDLLSKEMIVLYYQQIRQHGH